MDEIMPEGGKLVREELEQSDAERLGDSQGAFIPTFSHSSPKKCGAGHRTPARPPPPFAEIR